MDFASIAGILSGLSLIVAAIFLRGDLTNFFNIPGIMIVLGGTIASTLLTFPFKDVIKAFEAAFFVLYEPNTDPNDMVKTIIKLSNISRRQGIFTLGKIDTNNLILKKGCNLIALLTTFYGTILSTLFFLPIAGKLKARTMTEVINMEIIFEGAISILQNNNPLMVFERLSSFIPPRDRTIGEREVYKL